MTKQQDTIARISAMTLIGCAVIFCWWIVLQNFPASRRIVLSVPLVADGRMISRLQPDECVSISQSGAPISCDSVHFTVRSPAWFSHTKLVVTYQPNGRQLRGVELSSAGTQSQGVQSPLSDYQLESGLRQAIWDLDLRPIDAPDSVRTFRLITDGQPEQSLLIDRAAVTLEY